MPVTPSPEQSSGYVVKLVRDGIGEMLGGEGTITYERVGDGQHVALLRRKLIEEAAEYLTNPCVEELADVLAVLWSLAHVDLQAPFNDVVLAAVDKREQRGGFDKGAVMVGHHSTDGGQA